MIFREAIKGKSAEGRGLLSMTVANKIIREI